MRHVFHPSEPVLGTGSLEGHALARVVFVFTQTLHRAAMTIGAPDEFFNIFPKQLDVVDRAFLNEVGVVEVVETVGVLIDTNDRAALNAWVAIPVTTVDDALRE